MARPLRLNAVGGLFHVMNRGVERRPLFLDDADRHKFIRLLAETVTRYGWKLHSFVLMTDHFHLLVDTPRGNLTQGMHWLESVYAGWFNRRYGRVGALFQGRFKSILIQDIRYFLQVSHYIHMNPVKAGLVKVPWDYLWSSCRYFLGIERAPAWLETATILGHYTDLEDYSKGLSTCLSEPLTEAVGQAILGDRGFVASFLTREVLGNPYIAGRLDLGRRWDADQVLAALRDEGSPLLGVADSRRECSFDRSFAMYLLRELAGLPIAEVARLSGLTKGAVSVRVQKTRKAVESDPVLATRVMAVVGRVAWLGTELNFRGLTPV